MHDQIIEVVDEISYSGVSLEATGLNKPETK
jgi:hypothetical protein